MLETTMNLIAFILNCVLMLILCRASYAMLFIDDVEEAADKAGWCLQFLMFAGMLSIIVSFTYSFLNLIGGN